MGEINKITISKDAIQFGDVVLYPPFAKEKLEEILGKPEVKEQQIRNVDVQPLVYVWDSYGIAGFLSKDEKYYKSFIINQNSTGCHYKYLTDVFRGEIYVDKKPYRECAWKTDYVGKILKCGVFELNTFFIEDLTEDDEYAEMYKHLDRVVEIVYRKPRKLDKYKFTPIDEPVLTFSDFNFKLAVMQRLMYEKQLLLPKFDIQEFANEYPKREIDYIEEGYEPIKEVVDWFKNYQIPASLADEVDEIYMDGGSDIYLQIAPNWDGEDSSFDIKKISSEDLAQFKNLRKMTVMSEKYEKIAAILKKNGIEAKRL